MRARSLKRQQQDAALDDRPEFRALFIGAFCWLCLWEHNPAPEQGTDVHHLFGRPNLPERHHRTGLFLGCRDHHERIVDYPLNVLVACKKRFDPWGWCEEVAARLWHGKTGRIDKPWEEPMANELTTVEAANLKGFEGQIEKGMASFELIGSALAAIRDDRLYRADHKTFALYCTKRWDLSPQHVNRLIAAAGVVENLEPTGSKPKTESQVRALTQLPAEEQAEAWEEAVEEADGEEPTAAEVAAVVKKRKAEKKPEPELLDEVGKPLPAVVRADFERAHEFDEIVRDLHGIKKRAETLAQEPLGKFLPLGPVAADIENAKRQVKHAKPYAVCCYCKGKERNCKACKGGGWLPKGQHEAAPEGMK